MAGDEGSFSVDPFKSGFGVALESAPNIVWDGKIGNPEGGLVATSNEKTGGGIFIANSAESLLSFGKVGSILTYGVQFESLSSDSKSYAPVISFRSTTSDQFVGVRFALGEDGTTSVFADYSNGDKPVTDVLVASKLEFAQDQWTDAAASLTYDDEKNVSFQLVLGLGNKAEIKFATEISDAGKQEWAATFGESGLNGGVSNWDNLNYKFQQASGGTPGVEAVPEASTWAAIVAVGAMAIAPVLRRRLQKQPKQA